MRLLAMLLVFVADSASATTAVRATLSELVADSEVVVLGTAGTPTSYWEGGRIFTRVPVLVNEVWAGDGGTGAVIEVVTLGGEVDGIGQRVSGALRMARGERVVLCLHRRLGALRLVHMSQGAFFVAEDKSTDPPVRRRSFGLTLVDGPAPGMPATLRALENAIREADHARR